MLTHKLRQLVRAVGFDVIKYRNSPDFAPDASPLALEIFASVEPFTMTTPIRVHGLVEATKYIVNNDIPGAFVECGVWKGGSAMAIALTLRSLGATDREIWLYDTFSGMPAPDDADVSYSGKSASQTFEQMKRSEDSSDWCASSIDEVRANVGNTGYPAEHTHFIEGKVEETIPQRVPDEIALLRLDTDWYSSTKHELVHLFPLLSAKGILIIDDYGFWQGSRKAVDEYIEENNICLFLSRMDHSGRIAVKA